MRHRWLLPAFGAAFSIAFSPIWAEIVQVAAPPLLAASDGPVISAIRYTLEIAVGGQRYVGSSVVQTTIYNKSRLLPEIGQPYRYVYRGEGLGLRLADGRALVVKFPGYWYPPKYEVYKREVVERFAAEGRSFPMELRQIGSGPPEGLVFDDAIAPKTVWQFDWLHPEATLGADARIVRFDMTPTREPPTFDIGKTIPWFAATRHEHYGANPQDSWHGYAGFGAKLTGPDALEGAEKVTLTAADASTDWLDASKAFSRGYGRSRLVSNIERVDIQYAPDLTRITVFPERSRAFGPTALIQELQISAQFNKNRGFWTPILCVAGGGCADILAGHRPVALIEPRGDTVYVVERTAVTARKNEFQLDQR
jgi:hypothetical protein